MISFLKSILGKIRKPEQVKWFRLPIEKRLILSSNAIKRIL